MIYFWHIWGRLHHVKHAPPRAWGYLFRSLCLHHTTWQRLTKHKCFYITVNFWQWNVTSFGRRTYYTKAQTPVAKRQADALVFKKKKKKLQLHSTQLHSDHKKARKLLAKKELNLARGMLGQVAIYKCSP